MPNPDTTIRRARPDDESFIREMQFEALFVPPGDDPFPGDVVDQPHISRYWAGFGTRPGDLGSIALDAGAPIGAAWLRRFDAADPGYGFIDGSTPELGIAVAADYRGVGLGTRLLDSLTDHVGRMSLSIDARNPAYRLYERKGFVVMSRSAMSLTMLRTG